MIADDEKVAIDSLKFIIERSFTDARVTAIARSGREAVAKARENNPDILFMDIQMPGINGIEAIRKIRESHEQIAIIVITAYDQFEYAKEAINLGVMEYLLKPVNRIKVVDVLSKIMGQIRTRREKQQQELELREKLKYAEESLKSLRLLQDSYLKSGYVVEFSETQHFQADEVPDLHGEKEDGLISRAKKYIRENYSKSITLEDVSREVHVSPQYLSKLFKEETGENFIDYLTAVRIRISKNMMEDEKRSIKDICFSVGYSDPNYFSRIFKKIVGYTPTEYKEEVLNHVRT